jgi:hypothetical protein
MEITKSANNSNNSGTSQRIIQFLGGCSHLVFEQFSDLIELLGLFIDHNILRDELPLQSLDLIDFLEFPAHILNLVLVDDALLPQLVALLQQVLILVDDLIYTRLLQHSILALLQTVDLEPLLQPTDHSQQLLLLPSGLLLLGVEGDALHQQVFFEVG